MREDDQIHACLEFKKHLIISSGWEVESENEQAAEFISWQFEELNTRRILKEILSAFDYGFSVSEKVLVMRDTPHGSKVCYKAIKTRPPHTWEILQDQYGNVTGYRQKDTAGTIVQPEKAIHFIGDAEFDNPYGRADLNLGVYRAWWAKRAIIKFWNIYLERVASPKAVAKYGPTLSEDLREQLQGVVNNMQSNTGIVLPDSVVLDWMESTRENNGYEKAIDKYNLMISRAMLFPDLLGVGGSETSGGSFALGQEHVNLFFDALRNRQGDLERAINNQLVAPLVKMNFAGDVDVRLRFNPMSRAETEARINLFLEASKAGTITPDEKTENWIREKIGLEPVEDYEEKHQPPPALQQPKDENTGDDAEEEATDDIEEEDPEEIEGPPPRENSLQYDRKVDYKKIESFYEEQEGRLSERLAAVIQESVQRYVKEVQKRNIIGRRQIAQIRKIELRGWNEFGRAVKAASRESFNAGREDGKSEIGEQANNAIEYVEFSAEVDPLEYLEQLNFRITADTRDEILKRLQVILADGIRNGLGEQAIVQQFDEALKDYDTSFVREVGGERAAANRLSTIVRTHVSKAYNEGRRNYFEQAGQFIQAYQFSAILDGRETPRCHDLNGKIFRKAEAQRYWPPIHFNCRSLMVPITTFEKQPVFSDLTERAPLTSKRFGGKLASDGRDEITLQETPPGYFK